MPRAKDPPMPMDFRVLMTQIRWRLEAEGRGQVKELVHVMRHQLAQVGKTLRPRANPLSSFQWRVFQGVSNYFWSGSVRRHYTPSNLKQRPYLNVSQLSSLDSDLMSFDQLVEFVQSNGNPRFKWPRKSKKQKGGQKSIKHMNYLSDKAIIPISLPHSSNSLPDTGLAQSTTASLAPLPPKAVPVPTSVSPVPRLSWDDDMEMVSTSSMAIKDGPKTILSFACRAGWNLNKKATWVPAAGITPEPCEFFSDASKIDYCLDQPSISSTIVFTRVPEKDVEAFLKNFLRREEGLNNDLK